MKRKKNKRYLERKKKERMKKIKKYEYKIETKGRRKERTKQSY